jgi:hypothetical protein
MRAAVGQAAKDVALAEIGALIQHALRLLAAAQVLLWCSTPEGAAAALELRAEAGTLAAAAAARLGDAGYEREERFAQLSRALRVIANPSSAAWPRAELYSRLSRAYQAAGLLLPAVTVTHDDHNRAGYWLH